MSKCRQLFSCYNQCNRIISGIQCRNTITVAIKHEIDRPHTELRTRPNECPSSVPIYNKIYETVNNLAFDSNRQLINVLLLQDVPGLGESGQIVQVHRSRYWHYLQLLKLAEICKDAAVEKSAPTVQNARVLTGDLYRTLKIMEAMLLLVPIKVGIEFQLNEKMISVAFRRYGLEVPRHTIRLPDKPPSHKTANREFSIGVAFNRHVAASVRCRVRLVDFNAVGGGLPPAELPKVTTDDWLAEMHPMPQLPKFAKVHKSWLLQDSEPDFEQLLKSNRIRIKKQ